MYVGDDVSVNIFPFPSVKVSLNVIFVRLTFPVFCTVILYFTMSPLPVIPSPLSVIVDVLVTSIEGEAARETSVKSFIVLPSVSSPSSLSSNTSRPFTGYAIALA